MYLCTISKTALWASKSNTNSSQTHLYLMLCCYFDVLLYLHRSIFIEASEPVSKFHVCLFFIMKLDTRLLSESLILGGDGQGDFKWTGLRYPVD